VKLTTHLHLVPRLSMRGAVPPRPHDIFMAWCLVKHRNKLYCYLYIYLTDMRSSKSLSLISMRYLHGMNAYKTSFIKQWSADRKF